MTVFMRVRKNVANMSVTELNNFVLCVQKLKNSTLPKGPEHPKVANPPKNRYDEFIYTHVMGHNEGVHRNAIFLPWHRVLLNYFELALNEAARELQLKKPVTVPYWNWSTHPVLPAAGSAGALGIPFTEHLLGGDGGPNEEVQSGPFARGKWKAWDPELDPTKDGIPLKRTLGVYGTLSPPIDVEFTLAAEHYGPWEKPDGFVQRVEGFWNRNSSDQPPSMHNAAHNWVGGQMSNIMISPNDPVFWLVHSYVDKLWADWQMLHHPEPAFAPVQTEKDRMYFSACLGVPGGWRWGGSAPAPLDVVNHYLLGYVYDDETTVPTHELPKSKGKKPPIYGVGPKMPSWWPHGSSRAPRLALQIELNPNCGRCSLEFEASGTPRPIQSVRHAVDEMLIEHDVVGWSSEGGGSPMSAHAVRVQHQGGPATLILGGDWGLRITPCNGRPAFGATHLLVAEEATVE